jgi:hypothetical protein
MMFKLAEQRGDSDGPYCGPEGLYLAPSPLIAKFGRSYRLRAAGEIAALIEAAYSPSIDANRLLPGLQIAADALQQGEIARAMIAAVHLQLGEIRRDRLARIAQLDSLRKSNFNPDEPRDWHGRWTTEGGENGASGEDGGDAASDASEGEPGGESGSAGAEADTGSGGAGLSAEGEGSSQPRQSSAERVWERFSNADFRNRLAIAEQTADKPNSGYTEVHEGPGNRFALGRYQITKAGLNSAGMMDENANWTGKYGINSRAQFLASPEAQEMALTDLLNDTERQLRANGSFRYIGTTIDGLVDRFTVTRAGLLAAGHRYGARETRDYLDEEASSGFSSARASLTPADRAVETRLRTFADVRYE